MISEAFIAALIMVESSGNDHAHGKHGEVGCLQIKVEVIADVNTHHHRTFHVHDRYSRGKSIEIFRLYVARYCSGDRETNYEIARLWHLGPTGRNAPETESFRDYWARIQYFLHEKHTSNTRGAMRRSLDRLLCFIDGVPHTDSLSDRARRLGIDPDEPNPYGPKYDA
jgi:hypothetical protein